MDIDKYNQLPTDIFKYLYRSHDLYFTPNGQWAWDLIDNRYKKRALDAQRVDNLDWEDYPNDNFGRLHLLNTDIVVLDIDNEETTIVDNTITIPALGITIPIGLYTQTSNEGSYHIYYRATPTQRNEIGEKTIIGLKGTKVDILQNYIVFEGHQSPKYKLHEGDILPLPNELAEVIAEYIDEKKLSKKRGHSLLLQSNPSRQYLIEKQLSGELEEGTKEYNDYIRSIFPKEYLPSNAKKLDIAKSFKLSYDLINKMLVKLTTTKELGFHEHVLPTLEYVLIKFGINPSSSKTKQRMTQMLPSLPQHAPIATYHWYDDNRQFVDMIREQPSKVALFKTQHQKKLFFIAMHKTTLDPLIYSEEGPFFDKSMAEAVAPEYKIIKEDGSKGAFITDDIPLIMTFSDPYHDEVLYDESAGLYNVNLSRPSKYIREAEPIAIEHKNNFLYNIMCSTVHPDYLELILYWHTQILFGRVPPLMVPWIATGDSVLGGTGKSFVTITILDKALAGQSTVAKLKDIKDGWDFKQGLRLTCYDEGDSTNQNEWLLLHNHLKISSGGNRETSNSKYGSMTNKVQLIAQAGASNSIPPIPESDRRILCLEPAHLEGYTQPISQEERSKAAEFERNYEKYEDDLQEYVNHLCFLARGERPAYISKALFEVAPKTIYRDRWMVNTATNSRALLLILDQPDELWSYIHWDRVNDYHLSILLSYLIHQYRADLGKVALSWEWFRDMLYLIQAQEDENKTKREVIRALGNKVHFKQTSGWSKTSHDEFIASAGDLNWSAQLEHLPLSKEAVDRYEELKDELVSKDTADINLGT